MVDARMAAMLEADAAGLLNLFDLEALSGLSGEERLAQISAFTSGLRGTRYEGLGA
jgi:hypothetical protein